ncbi:hydroxyisourate hydrolase [Candidatus Pelagibacter sp. HIMB1623]|uniref:hydroxyisourate hydrolase n=1 Tax=Candidatus Pelagibacter sp. HIMB1623 TaxID=3413358 RepID=UPI003F8350B5
MATISSHLLNSVDGNHANGVKVTIYQINSSGEKKIFFETETDEGGRILKDFELSNNDCACEYEMVCKTGDYFSEKKVVSEIIVKFKMENPKKKYHLPIIISPNGYSIWWSK